MISRAARKRLLESSEKKSALKRLLDKYVLRYYPFPDPHHAAGRARTGGIPWWGRR